MTPDTLPELLDHISGEALTVWMNAEQRGISACLPHLAEALPDLAQANRRWQNAPLLDTLCNALLRPSSSCLSALRTLTRMGASFSEHPRLVPALLRLLNDSDPQLCTAAIAALVACHPSREHHSTVRSALLQRFREGERSVRMAAAQAIAQWWSVTGDHSLVWQLWERQQMEEGQAQYTVALAFRRVEMPADTPALLRERLQTLIAALSSPEPPAVIAEEKVIRQERLAPEPWQALAAMLEDDHPQRRALAAIRMRAAQAEGIRLFEPPAENLLRRATGSLAPPRIQVRTVEEWSRTLPPLAVVAVRSSPHWTAAALPPWEMPVPEVVADRLLQMRQSLADDLLTVWHTHRAAIGQGQAPHLVGALSSLALSGAFGDREPALSRLHRQALPPAPQEVRRTTAQAVALIAGNAPSAGILLPILFRQLEDEHRATRALAAGALAGLIGEIPQSEDLVPALLRCLEPLEGHVTETLKEAVFDPDVLLKRLEVLRNNSPARLAWSAAACALGGLEPGRHRPALLRALRMGLVDRAWIVGMVAAETLERLGASEEVCRDLLESARRPHSGERQQAVHGICRLAIVTRNTDAVSELRDIFEGESLLMRLCLADTLARLEPALPDRSATHRWLQTLITQKRTRVRPLLMQALARNTQPAVEQSNFQEIVQRFLTALSSQARRPVSGEMENVIEEQEATLFVLSIHARSVSKGASPSPASSSIMEMEQAIRSLLAEEDQLSEAESEPHAQGFTVLLDTDSVTFLRLVLAINQTLQRFTTPWRMALTQGNVRLMRDADGLWTPSGKALLDAQNLASLGADRQVLASQEVGEALRALPSAVSFVQDLGWCRTRDFGLLRLFNLVDPGGRFGNPIRSIMLAPSETAARSRNSVPSPSRKVGREILFVYLLPLLLLLLGGALLCWFHPELLQQFHKGNAETEAKTAATGK